MVTPESVTDGGSASPRRRSVLAAMGAVTGGAIAAIESVTAQQADGQVETRGCSDGALTPEDWSTGAVTVQACQGSSGELSLSVTGNVSTDRFVQNTAQLPASETVFVSPGQRQTLWFTGRITSLSCSSSALNIGIAHRG